MAKPALEAIATLSALRAAWRHVSRGKLSGRSALASGTDGESLDAFAQQTDLRLAHLSRSLRSGSYSFSMLRPVFVPKPNGKKRLICVPTVSDRIVQRAILDYLTPRSGWLTNGISHGFVPDLGVPDAVELAVRYRAERPWAFKTDITAFFDRIDRRLLCDRLRSYVRHRSLHRLLEASVACEIQAGGPRQAKELKAMDIRPGRGARQGMPLSPFFANVVLERFDRSCKDAGHYAIRYADDLIFFAESEEQAVEIGAFCKAGLAKLNLEIPELTAGSKTQIYAPGEPAEFLGVQLRPAGGSYELAIPPAQMTHIKERIYSYGNLRELKTRGLDITRFGASLRTAADTYASTYAYCANAADLRNHLEEWRRETMKRVITELGLSAATLTADQRWFLTLDE